MIAAPALHALDIGPPPGHASPPPLGALWDVLAAVPDPEIPVVSVVELGILRGIEWDTADSSTLVVTVTPTYSGCPATDVIMEVDPRRRQGGRRGARADRNTTFSGVDHRLDDSGRKAETRQYGIAPA